MKEKEALIFFGSPNESGYTSKLLSDFIFKFNNINFNIINSYRESLNFCIGCSYCRINNSCKFKDFKKIDGLIKISDLIIIASPVYNLTFPASLKNIFDRFQVYFLNKNLNNIKNKIGAVLLTCGSDSDDSVLVIKKQVKLIFNLINTEFLDIIIWKNTDKINNYYPQKELKKIINIINSRLNLL